jgi:hypothetical protein
MTSMIRRRTLTLAAVTAAVLLAAPGIARACGGFFSETNTSEVTVMSDIRVLLVKSGNNLEQYVQVAYTGAATRFAWIYPVASNPKVSEAAKSPFDALEEVTRPRIMIHTMGEAGGGGGGGGCMGDDGDAALRGGNEQVVDPSVKLWQKGQVGSFDYVVLTATTSDDLLTWLNTNGFAVPAKTKQVVGHYVAMQWYFVAMKVSATAGSASSVPSTTVIKLAYSATEVRYPLKMVTLSPAPATSVELYLVDTDGSKQLVPTAPFTATAIDQAAVKPTSETEHTYEAAFNAAEAAGGRRGLVLEAATTGWQPSKAGLSIPSGSSLVRLRASFGPDDMDQDLVFVEQPHAEVSSTYNLDFFPSQGAAMPWLLLLAVLGWRVRKAIVRS